MARLNILVNLQAFSDQSASNNPLMNNFKWTREMNCLEGENPKSDQLTLYPGQNMSYFGGLRTLTQDGTTEYSISQKNSSTYVLSWEAGALPGFAAARVTLQDNTSAFAVTKNGTLATFTNTGGTAPVFTPNVSVGDWVEIDGSFNAMSQGTYQVMAVTATSFTVENQNAVAEVVTLSAASDLLFYGLTNAQKEDTLRIYQGFSPAAFGSYTITKVLPTSLEFYSPKLLPAESIVTEIQVLQGAKKFVYVEASSNVKLILNGGDPIELEPFQTASGPHPGVFMLKSTLYSILLQNDSLSPANLFIATLE